MFLVVLSLQETESPIMFTRLDAERNAKNLKRALNNNKLSEERYHEAVEKMDAYVSLPAKRFAELVKKYVHHRNMMRIEGKSHWGNSSNIRYHHGILGVILVLS